MKVHDVDNWQKWNDGNDLKDTDRMVIAVRGHAKAIPDLAGGLVKELKDDGSILFSSTEREGRHPSLTLKYNYRHHDYLTVVFDVRSYSVLSGDDLVYKLIINTGGGENWRRAEYIPGPWEDDLQAMYVALDSSTFPEYLLTSEISREV